MSKKMKISITRAEKITDMINGIEGRRYRNTLSVSRIIKRAALAEEQMAELKIPKSHRSGLEVIYGGGGGASSKSYGYSIPTTMVRLLRGTSAWFVTEAWSQPLYPLAPQPDTLVLTPAQDKIAVNRFRGDRYTVKKDDAG